MTAIVVLAALALGLAVISLVKPESPDKPRLLLSVAVILLAVALMVPVWFK